MIPALIIRNARIGCAQCCEALDAPEFAALVREEAPRATKEQLVRVHPARIVDVDLNQKAGPEPLLAKFNEPIEDRLPVSVAGEIVVGDEETRNALRRIQAHDLLDVVVRRGSATCGPAH